MPSTDSFRFHNNHISDGHYHCTHWTDEATEAGEVTRFAHQHRDAELRGRG